MHLPKAPEQPKPNDITDEERLLLYAELAEKIRQENYSLTRPNRNGRISNGHYENGKKEDRATTPSPKR
ncbi:unnamed protein product [Larinioides sclopetarius]|uniref:Uncharacterized protein n=1 Tax=Larinioides sclopetarius TaxID=280406 RepID=A0AAV1ZVB6_9ARAC